MKKLTALLLALVMVATLASCGGLMGDINDKDPQGGSSAGDAETIEVTLAEQVIFEGNDIKVTATGMDYSGFFGPSVKVLIENNSTANITVQTRDSSINGLMVDTVFSADVAAGKKANDTITFSSDDLEAAGITTIKDIELVLHIIDGDSWDDIADSDVIRLTTSADASFVQTFDDSGHVAYEADGVKIVVKKLNSSDSFWGSDLYLYMENNTEKNITVQARDVSVNGFMVDPVFSCEIVAGKKAFDTMSFMESDLTDNGITDITEMELKFHIYDADGWDTIKDTDAIQISFE